MVMLGKRMCEYLSSLLKKLNNKPGGMLVFPVTQEAEAGIIQV